MEYLILKLIPDNLLEVCFLNKEYHISIQTLTKQIVISIFLIEKPVFNWFWKVNAVQHQLPVTFCSDLGCKIKILKARNSTLTHTNLLYPYLHIKSKQKVENYLYVSNDRIPVQIVSKTVH